MTLKKKMVVIAAAGAVTAAAVPAFAFENEFHGMFRLSGVVSNFQDGTSGPGYSLSGKTGIYPGPMGTATFLGVNQNTNGLSYGAGRTKTFFDQRARLQYIAKASDDLKLVTHFEVDSRWGDNSYAVGRNQGGAIGADSVSIETKSVYLDFKIPSTPVQVKAGIQPIVDAYKGILYNTDAAGALATAKTGPATTAFGWFRLDDSRTFGNGVGKKTRDLLVLDSKFAVNKDMKVGASYYYYNDDYSGIANAITAQGPYIGGKNASIHMFGVNAEATAGPLTVDGFFLYQNGVMQDTSSSRKFHKSAFAANVGAKAKLPFGTVRTNLLYTSGEKDTAGNKYGNGFTPIINESSNAYGENSFYDANMHLLMRGKYVGSVSDRAVVYDNGNNGQGIIAGFLGYDASSGKVFGNFNAGFLAAAKTNKAVRPVDFQTGGVNAVDYMGTEVNAEIGYKLYDNMSASIQGAYVFLGSYWNNTIYVGKVGNMILSKDPDNPFLGRIMLNYTF